MPSSAKPSTLPVTRLVCTLAACAVVSALPWQGATAADSAWPDVEGRIQYGFYTEDARSLADLAEQLTRSDTAPEPLRYYYAGLANYWLAQLLATKDKDHARQAVERCVSNLDSALKAEANLASGFALQSACLRTLTALRAWKPLTGGKSNAQMERAVKLAPRDPRVLLLEALGNGDDGRLDERSLITLRKAADAFESERHGVERTPGWGAAEAYTHLGRGYLERGDVLKARDALERALLIAPDFVRARRLLLQITSG